MRPASVTLVACLALLAGAVEARADDSTGKVADVASPALTTANAGAHAAKEKRRSKGKGEGKGEIPGAVPGKGPRSGKPPRPVMARRAPRGAKASAPMADFLRSGFRVTSAGSEVVLQTSAEVELDTRGTQAAPSFVLRRCRALRANDRRPLDTRYFATAVTSVAVRQRGRDLVVRVTLREPADATPRKERGPGETWSWIVAFAAAEEGKEGKKGEPSPSAPTATAAVVR